MSRIGKQPIKIPSGITVEVKGQSVSVKGPKGALSIIIRPEINVVHKDGELSVSPKNPDERGVGRFHGLSRTLINNMVIGCSEGFTKTLSLVGVGYRAALSGRTLTLNLGYSHPIEFNAPDGIDFQVEKNTTIRVSGCSKELVGQVSAEIRELRRVEVYHGKGVRYADENVITKVGKAAGKK